MAALPIDTSNTHPPAPDAVHPRQTLLVVDDDALHRGLLCELLEEEGDVLMAGEGLEAIDMASELQPDLILLDMIMPGMNGLEVLQALKADPRTRDIAVIFLTALDQPANEARSLALGAVDYITKPFHPPVVVARVAAHLRMAAQRKAMSELVFVDELTGIANRRHFDDVLRAECGKARRTGRRLTVGMVDVDFFKQFNDRYGHVAGDEALRAVATALRQALRRPGDFVARFGGEEFALIVPDTGDDAVQAAEALGEAVRAAVRALELPHEDSDAGPVLTVSVGLATGRCTRPDDALLLLDRADQCLYAAKESGRNRVVAQTV